MVARESARQPRSRSPGFLEVRTKDMENQVRLGTVWQAHLPGHKHSKASTSLRASSHEDKTLYESQVSGTLKPRLQYDTLGL